MTPIEPTTLKPGSYAARRAGCTCPVIDNHYGAGRYGNGARFGWFVSGDCAVHGKSSARKAPP